MFPLGKVLIRRTWRAACASRKQPLMFTPLANARAQEACLLHSGISANQTSCRFLSTLQSDSVETEDEIKSPLELVADDSGRVYKEIMGLLRKNIDNEEMHEIATKYYRDFGENNLNTSATVTILLAKAINCHLYKDDTMTDKQIKLLAILDMILCVILLRDDLVDNSKTRKGAPTAHTIWHPMKVIFTLNKILAICVSEAGKFGSNVLVKLCQSYRIVIASQLMIERMPPDGGEFLSNYMLMQDYKGGSYLRYNYKAIARFAGANDSLVDIASRLGYHTGMSAALLDEFWDMEDDLRAGTTRGPVIFAMREYPELREMALRKYGREGDVERALELVNNSRGCEEYKTTTRLHSRLATEHLNLIADSPYKRALDTLNMMSMLTLDDAASTSTTASQLEI